MRKSTGNASSRQIFSVVLFPVIVILWMIGWILYYQGSREERSVHHTSKLTAQQKNRNTKKKTSEPEILEAKIAI